MTSKERINLALDHKEADRIALHDSPWGTTIERWHNEGLPADVGPAEFFHYEISGIGADTSFRFPPEVVEETEEYRITKDANGALSKNWKHATSTPERIDFTIKTPALWAEHKPRLAWAPDRMNLEAAREAEAKCRETGQWFYFSCAFGYDGLQAVVGSERLLMAMAQEPAWVQEMFDTWSINCCHALEELIAAGLQFDGAFAYDDMGYRNASLFSPAMFRRYEFGNHKRFYDCAQAHGLKCILHSCGCVKELIPGLIEAGLSCLQPLEVKAGMDLIELKQAYGEKLSFMGGIDVRKMALADPGPIEEEIRSKILAGKAGGGYIYHSDHSVPDNVSWSQYQHVIDLVHKYGAY